MYSTKQYENLCNLRNLRINMIYLADEPDHPVPAHNFKDNIMRET